MDNTPLLSLVLYTGHQYMGRSGMSSFFIGFIRIMGIVSNRTFGVDSANTFFSRSQRAPSTKRPFTYAPGFETELYFYFQHQPFWVFTICSRFGEASFLFLNLKKKDENQIMNKLVLHLYTEEAALLTMASLVCRIDYY